MQKTASLNAYADVRNEATLSKIFSEPSDITWLFADC